MVRLLWSVYRDTQGAVDKVINLVEGFLCLS